MTWFKLAGEGAFHAKVLEAGNEAYGAWARAGQWSSDHLTEGRIPRAVALSIGPEKLWKRLVAAKAGHEHGLAIETPDGWLIHDYLRWNPSAEVVRERREETSRRRSEAGRNGGRRSGEARRAKQPRSKTEANDQANAEANDQAKRTPVPVPLASEEAELASRLSPPSGETWISLAQRCAEAGSSIAASFEQRLADGRTLTKRQREVLLQVAAEQAEQVAPSPPTRALTFRAPPPASGLDTSPEAMVGVMRRLGLTEDDAAALLTRKAAKASSSRSELPDEGTGPKEPVDGHPAVAVAVDGGAES